mmetsp:Transcript_16717/g.36367  ORF Transcript_16717/g.36367 Transcript_16717/m.36367 type:complete len:234 (+) Transcript_16717:1028-1729(+)
MILRRRKEKRNLRIKRLEHSASKFDLMKRTRNVRSLKSNARRKRIQSAPSLISPRKTRRHARGKRKSEQSKSVGRNYSRSFWRVNLEYRIRSPSVMSSLPVARPNERRENFARSNLPKLRRSSGILLPYRRLVSDRRKRSARISSVMPSPRRRNMKTLCGRPQRWLDVKRRRQRWPKGRMPSLELLSRSRLTRGSQRVRHDRTTSLPRDGRPRRRCVRMLPRWRRFAIRWYKI